MNYKQHVYLGRPLTVPEKRVHAGMDVAAFYDREQLMEIANRLGFSYYTLRAYRGCIRKKLGIVPAPVPLGGSALVQRDESVKLKAGGGRGHGGRFSYLLRAESHDLPRCHCGLLLPCYHG